MFIKILWIFVTALLRYWETYLIYFDLYQISLLSAEHWITSSTLVLEAGPERIKSA